MTQRRTATATAALQEAQGLSTRFVEKVFCRVRICGHLVRAYSQASCARPEQACKTEHAMHFLPALTHARDYSKGVDDD